MENGDWKLENEEKFDLKLELELELQVKDLYVLYEEKRQSKGELEDGE